MYVGEHDLPWKMLRGDIDKKYPKAFDDVFTTPTCELKRNLPALPNPKARLPSVSYRRSSTGCSTHSAWSARGTWITSFVAR